VAGIEVATLGEQVPEHDPMKLSAGLAIAAALATTLVAGCAGTANPTASPTEPALATASPTSEPTLAPTPTGTPAPTLIPYPGPSIPPGTLTIDIGADPNLKFDRTQLTVPADTPFAIAFENRDLCDANCQKVYSYPLPSIPHNVAIRLGDELLFNPMPTIFAPGNANYYISEGLPPGTYLFLCIVHPVQMKGTLTIT
jgi:hypothetical protein